MLIKTGIALALLSSTCFACQHGKFGSECQQTCSTHCSGNGSCNLITGDCDNGCKDGWTGSKCGTQQNTDGSTDIVIKIGAAAGTVGLITSGVAVLLVLLRKKKDGCGKQNTAGSSHTSHGPTTNNYHVQNALFVQKDCLEDVPRGIKSNIQNFELLAINPSA